MSTLLWHDDVRPAPEGWTWVKTNNEAKTVLAHGGVEEISMDHDLGAIPTGDMDPKEVMYLRGTAEETGLDLARWIAEHKIKLSHITIHSWNPWGAARMADVLREAGYNVTVKPFEL